MRDTRPHHDKMPPFEWLYWALIDRNEPAPADGTPTLAEGVKHLLSAYKGALGDRDWEIAHRTDVRREALEEAAKVCEAIDGRGSYTDTDLDDAFENGRLTCAEAIRALMEPKP